MHPQFFRQLGFIHFELGRQRAGDNCLIGSEQAGVGANRFHEQAGGQHVSARVEDVAAPRGMNDGALSSPGSLTAQVVMPHHLQIHQPEPQPREGRDQQQGHQCQPAVLCRPDRGGERLVFLLFQI